ncbi:hypothetical protein [Sphingobium aquiterrae]|uniref:hypothetical protein n=1 Tax=Sphingobium aquiterrae TaxID=2038656 RepID=UPI00301B1488
MGSNPTSSAISANGDDATYDNAEMSAAREGLVSEHSKGQAQLVYFLLGLAASAIAFAVHETDGKALKETPWPLGVAVVLWAFSFAMGCFCVTARQRAIISNLAFLDATKGLNHAQIDEHLPSAKKTTQDDINRPFKFFDWQLWTMFAGALFYIGGHVMQMAATQPKNVTPVAAPKMAPTRAPHSNAPHP